MSNRLAVVLALLAALALALVLVRMPSHGIAPLIVLLRVALILLATWGLARRAAWSRWLVTLMALLSLWVAVRVWGVPMSPHPVIAYFALRRAGRMLSAVLLVGAAAAAWEGARRERVGETSVEKV